ncbi:hypothetical protein [Paenibacillus dendritiformis]|uniref:hypothetical protein n=1 Tax=Paenibacillus dendritiformis TaxID=130049 RepID=UPI001F3F2500|nr:hypothetical protein [Paenibacillus dendritiformis]
MQVNPSWSLIPFFIAWTRGKKKTAIMNARLIKETKELIEKTKERLSDLKNKNLALLRVDGKANFTAQGTKKHDVR